MRVCDHRRRLPRNQFKHLITVRSHNEAINGSLFCKVACKDIAKVACWYAECDLLALCDGVFGNELGICVVGYLWSQATNIDLRWKRTVPLPSKLLMSQSLLAKDCLYGVFEHRQSCL